MVNFKSLFQKKPFKVKMRGIRGLEYMERGHKLFLDGELLATKCPSIYYWFKKNHKWITPKGKLVSSEDKMRIKKNIETYLRKRRITADIELN